MLQQRKRVLDYKSMEDLEEERQGPSRKRQRTSTINLGLVPRKFSNEDEAAL